MKAHAVAAVLSLIAAEQPVEASNVTVSFVDPSSYTDFGLRSSVVSDPERGQTADALRSIFRQLAARYLRTADSLEIQIIDVDLAGALQFDSRSGRQVRVMRPADVPRIRLKWKFSRAGVESVGEHSVTDLRYQHNLGRCRFDEPLCHEARMLDAWFAERFDDPVKR